MPPKILEHRRLLLGGPRVEKQEQQPVLVHLELDAVGDEPVVELEGSLVEGEHGLHSREVARPAGASPEAPQPGGEVRVQPGPQKEGAVGAEHPAQRLERDARRGEWVRESGRDPSGVATGGGHAGAVALQYDHLRTALLQIPGAREADDAAADDRDLHPGSPFAVCAASFLRGPRRAGRPRSPGLEVPRRATGSPPDPRALRSRRRAAFRPAAARGARA